MFVVNVIGSSYHNLVIIVLFYVWWQIGLDYFYRGVFTYYRSLRVLRLLHNLASYSWLTFLHQISCVIISTSLFCSDSWILTLSTLHLQIIYFCVRLSRHLTAIFYHRHHLPIVILQLLNYIFILLTAVSYIYSSSACRRSHHSIWSTEAAAAVVSPAAVSWTPPSPSLQAVDRHLPASRRTHCCCRPLLDPSYVIYVDLPLYCSRRLSAAIASSLVVRRLSTLQAARSSTINNQIIYTFYCPLTLRLTVVSSYSLFVYYSIARAHHRCVYCRRLHDAFTSFRRTLRYLFCVTVVLFFSIVLHFALLRHVSYLFHSYCSLLHSLVCFQISYY